jgi:hypothetical protein
MENHRFQGLQIAGSALYLISRNLEKLVFVEDAVSLADVHVVEQSTDLNLKMENLKSKVM